MLMSASVCLALNVYFEARNQNLDGQIAVAEVTLNRVADSKFPDDICSVVWDKAQFSWTHDGKSDRPRDKQAWTTAKAVAEYALQDEENTLLQDDVLFYHAHYCKPYWSKDFAVAGRIGSHIFYSRSKTLGNS